MREASSAATVAVGRAGDKPRESECNGPQDPDNPSQGPDNAVSCRGDPSPVTFAPVSESCPNPACAADRCLAPAVCPLNRVRAGTTVVVKRLTASPEVNQRLREMGFGEEQRIKVLNLQSNLLCQVCNARLGLSQKLAENILVEPLPATRLAA